MNINEILTRPEYDFFGDDLFKGHPIMFLTFGGSIAYGTNTPTSDIDIRGCALAAKSDLLGLTSFDHFLDEVTDTTVYSSGALIRLLASCNPNTIEMLGCKPETYIYILLRRVFRIWDNHIRVSRMWLSRIWSTRMWRSERIASPAICTTGDNRFSR